MTRWGKEGESRVDSLLDFVDLPPSESLRVRVRVRNEMSREGEDQTYKRETNDEGRRKGR